MTYGITALDDWNCTVKVRVAARNSSLGLEIVRMATWGGFTEVNDGTRGLGREIVVDYHYLK